MKTLIIHHLQPMWENGYNSFGTSFDELLEKTYNFIAENDFNQIIITNFEADFDLDPEQSSLKYFNYSVHDYMYGWELDSDDFDSENLNLIENDCIAVNKWGTKYAKGGTHSEIVEISEWMLNLEGEVYLCGAFDGECIEDMEIALAHCNIEFNRVEELII